VLNGKRKPSNEKRILERNLIEKMDKCVENSHEARLDRGGEKKRAIPMDGQHRSKSGRSKKGPRESFAINKGGETIEILRCETYCLVRDQARRLHKVLRRSSKREEGRSVSCQRKKLFLTKGFEKSAGP